MEISTEALSTVQTRVTIQVPSDVVDSTLREVMERYKQKAEVPGYRKGKVPTQTIEKNFGDSIAYEAADKLLRNHLYSAFAEKDIRPVSPPTVMNDALPVKGTPYSIVVVVDTLPTLEIKALPPLAIDYKKVVASDRDVEVEIYRTCEARENPNAWSKEEGDTFDSTKQGKFKVECFDGDQPILGLYSETVVMDSKKPTVWPWLYESAIGMKIGEVRENETILDGRFHDHEKVGKKVKIKLTLEEVRVHGYPEFDQVLETRGYKEGVQAWKDAKKKELAARAEEATRREQTIALEDQFLKGFNVELPPSVYASYIDEMVKNTFGNTQGGRAGNPKLLDSLVKDAGIRERMLPHAKERSHLDFIVQSLFVFKNIEISEDEIKAHFEKYYGMANPALGDEETRKQLEKMVSDILAKKDSSNYQNTKHQLSVTKLFDELLSKDVKQTVVGTRSLYFGDNG
jgi:trigger factor